jgi:D-amino-acid oxidase
MLGKATCPADTRIGFKYKSVMISVPQYLQYLLQRSRHLGASVIKEALPTHGSLEEALEAAGSLVMSKSSHKEPITGFVNATGLGAAKLVPDTTMFPIRGHTVTVRGEANAITTINFKPQAENTSDPVITYILPRPNSNTTVIGGTKQKGKWDEEPDQETTNTILKGAKPFAPELLDIKGQFTILSTQVGLRPGREKGVRCEIERLGKYVVCHAYGHSGAGESLCDSCK